MEQQSINSPVGNIGAKLAKVKSEIEAIQKTKGENNRAPYAYRGIEDIYNALGKLLAAHGIYNYYHVIDKQIQIVGSRGANPTVLADVTIRYYFKSVDDDSECYSEGMGQGIDAGNKAPAIAQTMACKSVLEHVFQIPTQDTADAESAKVELPPAAYPDEDSQFLNGVQRGRQNLNGNRPPQPAAKPQKPSAMQELANRCAERRIFGEQTPDFNELLKIVKSFGFGGVSDGNIDDVWGKILDDQAERTMENPDSALFNEHDAAQANGYPAN